MSVLAVPIISTSLKIPKLFYTTVVQVFTLKPVVYHKGIHYTTPQPYCI